MAPTPSAIPPPVSWAQRENLLYVVIDVECKDIEHRVTENTFYFKGTNLLDESKNYEVTLNFLHPVDPEKVSSKNIGRCLEFTIYKKLAGPYWSSLTTDKTKLHFLRANFAKWKNESDEEDDMAGGGDNMMFNDISRGKGMGMGMGDGGYDDLLNDDDDSDDNIPSLTPNDEDESHDSDDDEVVNAPEKALDKNKLPTKSSAREDTKKVDK